MHMGILPQPAVGVKVGARSEQDIDPFPAEKKRCLEQVIMFQRGTSVKNMTQKLKNNAGFTLAETLITVLILLMVSSVVAGGVPAAVNAYQKAVDAANSQVLLSTTVNALRSELSTAWGVSADNHELIYYSVRTGARTKLYNGTGNQKTIMVQDYLKYDNNEESQSGTDSESLKHSLVVRSGENKSDIFRVLYKEVKVEDDIISFESLGVYRDETLLQSMDLSIRIMNPDFVIPEFLTGSTGTP